jgi:hypothetical protein
MGTHSTREPSARVALRRVEVARRYLQKESIRQIAEAIGGKPTTIHNDLVAIMEEWRQSAIRSFDDAVAEELARINLLELTYWQAWGESRGERVVTTTEKSIRQGGKASIRSEHMAGNPAFLAGVQWCMDRRIKLLGLDAPTKVDMNVVYAEAERLASIIDVSVTDLLEDAKRIVEEAKTRQPVQFARVG